METVSQYLPLLNLVWTVFIFPAWQLMKNQQEQIRAQKTEIDELKKLNQKFQEELQLVKELVYSTIDPAKLKEHLIQKLQTKEKA